MTHPLLQQLGEMRTANRGGVPQQNSSPLVVPPAESPPDIGSPDEDPRFFNQVGNLYTLAVEGWKRYYRTLSNRSGIPSGPPLITRNELGIARDRLMTGIQDVVWKAFLWNTSPAYRDATIEGIPDAAEATAEATGQMFRHPIGTATNLAKVLLEPPLNLLSGKAVVNGEVVEATPDEVAEGALSIAALPVSIGTYSRLASAAPTIMARGARRAGLVAQNIGREYAAQAASGIVQEGITNPDEISLEMVLSNMTNPIILATSVVTGLGKSIRSDMEYNKNWLEENDAINRDATVSITSAKQSAITAQTPVGEALANIDAINSADNWVKAVIQQVKDGPASTMRRIVGAPKEAIKNLQKRNGPAVLKVKPKVERPSAAATYTDVSTQGKVHLFFDNAFDQVVMTAGKGKKLVRLAEKTGFDFDYLVKHQENIRKNILETPTQKGKDLSSKRIKEVALPEPAVRPYIYNGPKGEALLSKTPLTKIQADTYKSTGFIPRETVTWNNIQARFLMMKGKKALLQLNSGKFASANLADIAKDVDGLRNAWSKEAYNASIIDDFVSFLDSPSAKGTFSSIVEQYAHRKGWNLPGDTTSLENSIFRLIEERAGVDTSFIEKFLKIEDIINKGDDYLKENLLNKLDQLGYRLSVEPAGYKIRDIQGRLITSFQLLDDVIDFASQDFTGGNTPLINVTKVPDGVMPAVPKPKGWFSLMMAHNKIMLGKVLRRPDRMLMDITALAGVPEVGARIVDNTRKTMDGMDGMINGRAKRLMKMGEELVKKYDKVTPLVREQITRVLEQKSFSELFNDLTDIQKTLMPLDIKVWKEAGGIERVKTLFGEIRDGKKPAMTLAEQAGVELLTKRIADKVIVDSKYLRYIDVIENGVDLTSEQLRGTYKWNSVDEAAFRETKSVLQEASTVFDVDDLIEGYAPWIAKWKGIATIYNHAIKDSEFAHELNRLGLMPDKSRVMDIQKLVYGYIHSAILHKSPLPSGGVTGDLLTTINREIRDAGDLGVDMRPAEQWIANIKGIPDSETINAGKVLDSFVKMYNKNAIGINPIGTLLDLTALTKLGFRPETALRDIVGSSLLSYGLMGVKAGAEIFVITPERLQRIKALRLAQEIPAHNPEAILSRSSRSILSEAADVGINASLQPQVTELITGNAYIHTFDETLKAFRQAGGDGIKLVEILDELLDHNPKGVQRNFLDIAQRDPIEAAKYLARNNAYNIANRFGRLNNPLAWQGSFGRVLGQMGSWNLNTLTVLLESVANSRSTWSAGRKLMRMGVHNSLIYGASAATGLNLGSWAINPLTMAPGFGPIADDYSEIGEGFKLLLSPDEDERRFGRRMLEGVGTGIYPKKARDIWEGYKTWTDEGNAWKGLIEASGFKVMDE